MIQRASRQASCPKFSPSIGARAEPFTRLWWAVAQVG